MKAHALSVWENFNHYLDRNWWLMWADGFLGLNIPPPAEPRLAPGAYKISWA